MEHSIQPTPAELMKEKMRCNHAQQHSTRTLCPPHTPHAQEQRIRVSGGTGRHVQMRWSAAKMVRCGVKGAVARTTCPTTETRACWLAHSSTHMGGNLPTDPTAHTIPEGRAGGRELCWLGRVCCPKLVALLPCAAASRRRMLAA